MSTPRVVRVVVSNNSYKYTYYYTSSSVELFQLYTSIIELHSRSKSLVLIPYLGAATANRNKHRLVNFETEAQNYVSVAFLATTPLFATNPTCFATSARILNQFRSIVVQRRLVFLNTENIQFLPLGALVWRPPKTDVCVCRE